MTGDLMRQSAALAREYGVHLHTHLAETQDEEAFCLQKFGHRPVAYMQSLDWVGQDVWFAHAVYVNPDEDAGLRAAPAAAWRTAPLPTCAWLRASPRCMDYRAAGVKVGLGVDGSASNDGSHMLAEARQAMLLARLRAGLGGASLSSEDAPPLMTARQALELATRGGARCSAAPISARWSPANAPISSPSTWTAWTTPARCTIRSRRSCSAPRAVDCLVVGGQVHRQRRPIWSLSMYRAWSSTTTGQPGGWSKLILPLEPIPSP